MKGWRLEVRAKTRHLVEDGDSGEYWTTPGEVGTAFRHAGSWDVCWSSGAWGIYSDEEFKTDLEVDHAGSDFIGRLLNAAVVEEFISAVEKRYGDIREAGYTLVDAVADVLRGED